MLELNEAKLQSPIIFVDPTFKERNALATLSSETFNKFKKACKDFLANPDEKFFEKKGLEKELKKKAQELADEWDYNNRQGKIPVGIFYKTEKPILEEKWKQLSELMKKKVGWKNR